MKEKKLCDICNYEMKKEKRKCLFQHEGEIYHAEAEVYVCNVCGFKKLATGMVMFWENDVIPKKSRMPKVVIQQNGKMMLSDNWLDWMLEYHSWFLWMYDRFVPQKKKEKRYLEKYIPHFKAIINDILYDTETAQMFFMKEKDFGSEMCRQYYYLTKSGKFFSLTVRYGHPTEFALIELKKIKKLLSENPEIYKEVIPGEVLE